MSQCVPSWDLDVPQNLSPRHLRSSSSAPPQLSMSDYEVAELTWSNGHLLAHGLSKPTPKYPPSAAGTLESVVDQAKLLHPAATACRHPAAGSPNTNHLPATVDALVPTHRRQREDLASGIGSCEGGDGARKRARGRDQPTATSRSIDSMKKVVDETAEIGFATTNSVTPFADDGNGVSGSPDTENTSFGGSGSGSRPITTADDHDSVCHSQRRSLSQRDIVGEEDEKANERGTMRSTVSTKRSRAAAVHNQSERKRRDRINQKMRTLQKLVPNSSKTDKASMLDEVIDYLKQLQAQAQMMSRMSSMPAPMMMPMSMQQFQMAMMAQMAQLTQMAHMGMGMGVVDMASLGRAGPAVISPVMPASSATFLPMIAPASSRDPSAGAPERMLPAGAVMPMPEPFSAFVPCPTQQPMTMDAYQRMAALYPQMFQQSQPTNPK